MNTVTSLHKTLISKFLLSSGWIKSKDNESGSTYFTLKEDSSVKFRISDHFFAAYFESSFQLILSDLQPDTYVFIIHGNSIVFNSLKEVKSYITSITTLYRCSAKYFTSKGMSTKEYDAEYWKARYEEENIAAESWKNKYNGKVTRFNADELKRINNIKTANANLTKKNENQKDVITKQLEQIKKLKEELKTAKEELKNMKTHEPVYEIVAA